jgi:hypothetical protein
MVMQVFLNEFLSVLTGKFLFEIFCNRGASAPFKIYHKNT